MTTFLRYEYGPQGRASIGLDCPHGSTTIPRAAIPGLVASISEPLPPSTADLSEFSRYLTADGLVGDHAGAALAATHRAATGCGCPDGPPDGMSIHWSDATIALEQYERMVLAIPPEANEATISITLRELAALRAEVPCRTCTVGWTKTNTPGLVANQFHHRAECGAHAARVRAGTERAVYEPIHRSGPMA